MRTPDRDPLAKPEPQAPTSVSLCCLGGVRLGLRPLLAPSQLQGSCWPPARAWPTLCLGDAPSPLQAWTQVAGTVPVDPQRVGLGTGSCFRTGEGLHHLTVCLE